VVNLCTKMGQTPRKTVERAGFQVCRRRSSRSCVFVFFSYWQPAPAAVRAVRRGKGRVSLRRVRTREVYSKQCESVCVLFIGTQYSSLYTAVDTPAEAAWMNEVDVSATKMPVR
jgi:hypothetical protein